MKKIGKLSLIAISMTLWAAVTYGAVTLDLVGSTKFTRDKGKPDTEAVRFFSDFGGPATLKLINGNLEDPSIPKITSATISLNSKVVLGPSDFNQNRSQLQKEVPLNKGNNTLEVSCKSKPGAEVTIQIFQTISNAKVIPSSVLLAEPGGTSQLKVTGKLSNGTEVDITGSSFGTAYSSTDPGIATVTNQGLVTAVAYGQTILTVTNDDFRATVPVAIRGNPPTLSNLLLSRTLLPVPREYEQFILTLTFDFSDTNTDVESYNFTLTGPPGVIQSNSETLLSDQPTGTGSMKFLIDSSFEEGIYQVGIEILDAMGNSSGIQTISFRIEPTTERFFEITGIEPSGGKPGDRVVITGKGFELDPQVNNVTFERALGRAEVLSSTGTQLEVVVPEGARTGTIGLVTSLGRTDSLDSFTIVPTISLSPTSTQLLTESYADFSCVPSGTDTYKIIWSINGQTAPDSSLGTINNLGHFTAPSSPPPANPLTLRCTSVDVPTLYAEASITVVVPAPKPGQDLVKAGIGGQMTSIRGEVIIDISPGSMAQDTVITVEWVNPDTLPTPIENSYNLAAVKLEPSGLQFAQPVTLTFFLRNWEEPGTILTVYLADGTTGGIDTGKKAIVDETGLKASTTIEHFSTYFVSKVTSPTQIPLAYFLYHASDYIPYMNQFSIHTSEERPFLEGLSVPVVVKRVSGPGTLIGPFLSAGFTVKAMLSDSTPLWVGPLIQPSADGWELGTVIRMPVLPNCHEGETTGATLVIGFENLKLAQTITLPIAIQCLNELSFSRWTQPEHVPEGAWVTQDGVDGTVTVNISTEHTYRFSYLDVGEGGRLKVKHPTRLSLGSDPTIIEVTGDVRIEGEMEITGEKGSPGSNGKENYYVCWKWLPPRLTLCHDVVGGGYGEGGIPNGSDGGWGGPDGYGTSEGQHGYCFGCTSDLGGGWFGEGGLVWNKGSFPSLVYDVYSFVMDVVTIVESYGTAYTAYVDAIEDGYGAIQEGMKIWRNEKHKLLSAGRGGRGPEKGYDANFSTFWVPLGGSGAGGAGKMNIGGLPDAGGGGGGGGGGGAPSLKIVTPGQVLISQGGSINGKGGNGGHGGDGGGGWIVGQAAPGGGGGGGNGAQIHIISSDFGNKGTINLKGGLGGASGKMEAQDSGYSFIYDSFGTPGKNGVLRVDGMFSGNWPQYSKYYVPMNYSVYKASAATSSRFCEKMWVNLHDNYWGLTDWCFNPQPGLNSYSVNNTALHPWQKRFVFYYPGWQDSDGDGLSDGLELTLGTNPNNPDSDGDGLNDFKEVYTYGTDPLKSDTDGDGYSDGYEVAHGTNPKDPTSRPAYNLTVAKIGAGGGGVTSLPSGLDCGSTCQAAYLTGTKVTLYASPSSGSNFVGWSGGGCSGTNPSCTITIAADATVTANFEPQKTLTITKTGAGSGLVTSTPSGIDCGSTCQSTLPPTVTLHASSSSGSYFAGWSGGGCSGTASLCTITMIADTTVTADFEIPISGAQMAVGRKDHTATRLPNGKVLLVGGLDSNDSPLSPAEFYDPVTGTFSPTGSMGTGRADHTATLLPNGKVLVAAGQETNNPISYIHSSAELYDPGTGTFHPTGSIGDVGLGFMRGRHVGHTSTLLPDYGMVLIVGGGLIDPYSSGSSELYYIDRGDFGVAGEVYSMVTERSGHTATLLPNGRVLVTGGWGGAGTLSSAETYDIKAVDTFNSTGPMTTPREEHTATLLPNRKVLLAGGYDGNDTSSSAELYDPATEMFTTTRSMTVGRESHTATLLPNGKVLHAGGYDGNDTSSSAELYDPATEIFTTTGSMTAARAGHTATLLPNGKVLIAGGYNHTDGTLSSAEIYDPETGTFNSPGPGPSITLVPDAEGDLLLRNCDPNDPSKGCSLPPGAQLPLPGWFDIKAAKIAQNGEGQVELSIALYAPIPLAPPSQYSFVNYYWQFAGGCVQPAPGNKSAVSIAWRDWGNGTMEWRANWLEITSCNPRTTSTGASIPFEFTADGVKVRVVLADLLTAMDPGEPFYWHAGVRRLPFSHPTFTNTVPVDFAPNVTAFNPTFPPDFIHPEGEATWEPN